MRGEWQFGQRVAIGVARPQWWQRSGPRLVIDEGPLAFGTGLDMAAVAAQDDGCGPPSVDRQDRLVAVGKVETLDRLDETARQQPAVTGPKLLAEINDLDDRAGAGRPGGQDDPAVAALSRAPHALHRRRGAAKDDGGTGQLAEPDRDIPRLDPGRPVALVGRVVLLVDDDQPDVGERGEDRESRPHHDVDIGRPDPPPLVRPLALAEAGMDEGHADGEIRAETVDEGHGQRDLRDEDQGRPSALERRDDRLDVDRGLAAAGHSVEQERRRVAGGDRGPGDRDGFCLGCGQGGADGTPAAQADGPFGKGPPRPLANLDVDEAAPSEGRDRAGPVVVAEGGARQSVVGCAEQLLQRRDLTRTERPT